MYYNKQVLVLPKLLSKEVDSQIVKRENTEDIISSNIYGTHEVLVLRWLNYYFSKEGKRLFGKYKSYIHSNTISFKYRYYSSSVTII